MCIEVAERDNNSSSLRGECIMMIMETAMARATPGEDQDLLFLVKVIIIRPRRVISISTDHIIILNKHHRRIIITLPLLQM